MAVVTITYFLLNKLSQKDQVLGRKQVENIEEILVPISKKNKPFFITMQFAGHQCSKWRVEFMLGIKKDVWGIWLTEKDTTDDKYLLSTLATRNSAAQIIRKGTIVIVEYGHIYQSLNFNNGQISRSANYPCSNQEGEMHKRRPAIVIKADIYGAKIVPITSTEPQGNIVNHSIFELETDSTKYISEFKQGHRSFALCHMIQSVSYSRILPPLARPYNGKTRQFERDTSYPRRLSKNDMEALEKGLLTAIGMADLKSKNDKMHTAITQITESTRSRLSELENKYNMLMKLYIATDNTKSVATVEDEIYEWISAGIIDLS